MTNQYALGYKAALEAAVKVCRNLMHTATKREAVEAACNAGKAIAALPVPEVQWTEENK